MDIPAEQDNYDAFVLHNAEGKDLAFVKEMVEILEGSEHNIKLFLPWRDLHTTEENETEVLAEVLTKRCRCAIVVISSKLLQSEITKFLLSLANSTSPLGRNIIPLLIEDCEIPTTLKGMMACDFTKDIPRDWNWRRIVSSVKTPRRSTPHRPVVSGQCNLPDLLEGTK